MRRAWPAVVLTAGGLLMLASLYLPWEGTCGPGPCPLYGIEAPVAGRATALFALLLVGLAVALPSRPGLADWFPLGLCVALVAYFAVATGIGARWRARNVLPGAHLGAGAYLAIVALALVLVVALALLAGTPRPRASLRGLIELLTSAALLASLLFTWGRPPPGLAGASHIPALPGVVESPLLAAALLTLVRWGSFGLRARYTEFWLAAGITALTGGFVSLGPAFTGSRTWATWLGFGSAVALLAAASLNASRSLTVSRPPLYALAAGAGVAVFVSGLFLPWQTECASAGTLEGASRCVTENGWGEPPVSEAMLVAVALVVAISARRVRLPLALAGGFALLATTLGFDLQRYHGSEVRIDPRFGAIVSLAGATILTAAACARSDRPRWWPSLAQLIPVAMCAAYVGLVVVPWWGVLPFSISANLTFGHFSWLTVGGVLVALWLLGAWLARRSGELIILPVVLIALAAVDLIARREGGMTWGGGIVVGLTLVLAFCGWVDRNGLPQTFREIIRIDRL